MIGYRTSDLDTLFDDHLPLAVRPRSAEHFTPVEVARNATRMLACKPGDRVLDVGSGAGKFVIIAANAAPHATFVGVERDPELAAAASQIAKRLAVPNLELIAGDAFALDWSTFDAFYLFNPFVIVGGATLAIERLEAARPGTRVVTYYGLGGQLRTYEPVERFGYLECWSHI